jgi:hypothetical protein
VQRCRVTRPGLPSKSKEYGAMGAGFVQRPEAAEQLGMSMLRSGPVS